MWVDGSCKGDTWPHAVEMSILSRARRLGRSSIDIGVDSEPPHISPARGQPLWDDCGDEQMDDGVQIEPDWATDWDEATQPARHDEVDQRINW